MCCTATRVDIAAIMTSLMTPPSEKQRVHALLSEGTVAVQGTSTQIYLPSDECERGGQVCQSETKLCGQQLLQ